MNIINSKSLLSILFLSMVVSFSAAQSADTQICLNPDFDRKVSKTIKKSVAIISPNDLSKIIDKSYLLDTREKEEYQVSHIPGAHYASFSNFEIDALLDLPRDTTIVVYCSIGYRSEKIGEILEKEGFTNVLNLYGSLFEWANQSYPLEDAKGNSTIDVHTYNKAWSKWVDTTKSKKVW